MGNILKHMQENIRFLLNKVFIIGFFLHGAATARYIASLNRMRDEHQSIKDFQVGRILVKSPILKGP